MLKKANAICPQACTISPSDSPPCLPLHINDFPEFSELKNITVASANAVEFKFLECVCADAHKYITYSFRNKKIYADIHYKENLGNASIEHYFIIFCERNVNMKAVIERLENSIAQMRIANKKIQLVIVVCTFSLGIEMVNIYGEYHKLLNSHFGNAVDIKICPFKPKLRKYLELSDSNPLFLA